MADVTRLDEAQIAAHLEQTPGWGREGDEIKRAFEFENFQQAFGFLAQVAILAEKADHHPEIWNVYNQVRLALTTHDADGLTHKDFALAAQINAIGQ